LKFEISSKKIVFFSSKKYGINDYKQEKNYKVVLTPLLLLRLMVLVVVGHKCARMVRLQVVGVDNIINIIHTG
jgi:hypothetical protein